MTEHLVYRVANDSGIEHWSTVEALWAPWYQEKPAIKARVIAADGSVHELDANAVSETAAPEESLDIFSDNRILRAPAAPAASSSAAPFPPTGPGSCSTRRPPWA